jgi:L-seryl-tRNA(Ser) seleniumtransferase
VGLVVGASALVRRLAEHPVARVVRPDKLTLAALAATLASWKTGRWRDFPVYRAAAADLEALERRGEKIRAAAATDGTGRCVSIEVVATSAVFGGGTSPEKRFDSRALAVESADLSADELAAKLRSGSPPVVGRVEDSKLLLDLRSVMPEEDGILERALKEVAGSLV